MNCWKEELLLWELLALTSLLRTGTRGKQEQGAVCKCSTPL